MKKIITLILIGIMILPLNVKANPLEDTQIGVQIEEKEHCCNEEHHNHIQEGEEEDTRPDIIKKNNIDNEIWIALTDENKQKLLNILTPDDTTPSTYLYGFDPNDPKYYGFTDPSKGTEQNAYGIEGFNKTNEAELKYRETEEFNEKYNHIVDVYMLYNKHTGEHLMTGKKPEYDKLVKKGWKGEGTKLNRIDDKYIEKIDNKYYFKKDTNNDNIIDITEEVQPIYRIFNRNQPGGIHYYTSSKKEASKRVSEGWKWDFDGRPFMYAFNKNKEDISKDIAPGLAKVYKLYNKYGDKTHHYTKSKGEYDKLKNENKWIQEDVNFTTTDIPHIHNFNILEVNKFTVDMNVKEIYENINNIQACYVKTLPDNKFWFSDADRVGYYNLLLRYYKIVGMNQGTRCACGEEKMLRPACYGNALKPNMITGLHTGYKNGKKIEEDKCWIASWSSDWYSFAFSSNGKKWCIERGIGISQKKINDGKAALNIFKNAFAKEDMTEDILNMNAERYFYNNTGKNTFEEITWDTPFCNITGVNYKSSEILECVKSLADDMFTHFNFYKEHYEKYKGTPKEMPYMTDEEIYNDWVGSIYGDKIRLQPISQFREK